jgi:hypothetical protein
MASGHRISLSMRMECKGDANVGRMKSVNSINEFNGGQALSPFFLV